ncbi:hypothetical protein BACCAP_01607 [Pseudoflavonifractor capillosus ATCC 29799]|uniref:Uncharacterized protein n=1 Tax=Pseudoflavonifractor capillosus ATCC 29799 TaxID=411467 RepID=A6NTS9_9FIRM|nr:hypothetical protein BACCAP_01607 [Pseudoflavonifractor capillosus ATCC 29799]
MQLRVNAKEFISLLPDIAIFGDKTVFIGVLYAVLWNSVIQQIIRVNWHYINSLFGMRLFFQYFANVYGNFCKLPEFISCHFNPTAWRRQI